MYNHQSFKRASYRIIKWQITFVLVILLCIMDSTVIAQPTNQMVRLAKIKVDAAQIDNYNAALKEQIAAAIRIEPGVLRYYAVADKSDASSITILEIYASKSAYELHIETPHFKKYKATVKDMVKSLELTDVTLITSGSIHDN